MNYISIAYNLTKFNSLRHQALINSPVNWKDCSIICFFCGCVAITLTKLKALIFFIDIVYYVVLEEERFKISFVWERSDDFLSSPQNFQLLVCRTFEELMQFFPNNKIRILRPTSWRNAEKNQIVYKFTPPSIQIFTNAYQGRYSVCQEQYHDCLWISFYGLNNLLTTLYRLISNNSTSTYTIIGLFDKLFNRMKCISPLSKFIKKIDLLIFNFWIYPNTYYYLPIWLVWSNFRLLNVVFWLHDEIH